MNNEQRKQLADEALNLAILHIQNMIGQEYGDNAGMFFCGEWDALVSKFTDYIDYELFDLEVKND